MADEVQPTPPAGGGLPPVKAEPDPELARMRSELTKLTGQLSRMQPALPAQPTAQPATQPDKKELNRRFFEDPIASTAQVAAMVTQNITANLGAASYDTMVEVAKREAIKGKEKLWEKYGPETEALVLASTEQAPLSRQNIHVWRNGLNQVLGIHADEIAAAARAEANQPPADGEPNRSAAVHISSDGGPAGTSRNAPAPKAEKLSDDEMRVVRGLKITPEAYLAGKHAIDNQSEKGPSSWDKLITFDSKEKRRQDRANADKRNKPSAA